MNRMILLIVTVLPMLGGALLPLMRFRSRRGKCLYAGLLLAVEAILVTLVVVLPTEELHLFSMTEKLSVSLRADSVGKVFLCVSSYGYLLAGIFAFRYLEHAEKEGTFPENMFWSFYLLSLGALVGMDLSENLITMYFFFELVTLLSMPLVLFERTEESVSAAMKYLFYSIAGAFLALGCIFFLSRYSVSLDFLPGGQLDPALTSGHEGLLRTVIFLGIVGLGAKAGMYPLHGWLPTAHPVAPAPASAVLSGVITKAGVLAIIRVLYFSVGTEFLRGTWVQIALISLALLTVFMGSMMAFREKVFKKRLAYSSVSQISYVLTGLFLFNATASAGALMQVLFHATVKICLFLTAGSLIHNTGYHNVDEFRGLGKYLPKTLASFTLASLSLIGIPPFAGFVSKWYLAEGALSSELPVLNWLVPVVLLVSALLTAGYLLPVSVSAFFPGKSFSDPVTREQTECYRREGGAAMIVPLIVLAVMSLLLGLFGGTVQASLTDAVSLLM